MNKERLQIFRDFLLQQPNRKVQKIVDVVAKEPTSRKYRITKFIKQKILRQRYVFVSPHFPKVIGEKWNVEDYLPKCFKEWTDEPLIFIKEGNKTKVIKNIITPTFEGLQGSIAVAKFFDLSEFVNMSIFSNCFYDTLHGCANNITYFLNYEKLPPLKKQNYFNQPIYEEDLGLIALKNLMPALG